MASSRRVGMLWATGLTAIVTGAAGCASAPVPQVAKPPAVVVPGATGSTITIGGFAALTGADEASDAQTVAASRAYFAWLNAHGGVHGHRIAYRVLDDRGNAAAMPSLAHQLVDQDAVFALFDVAGAAENRAADLFLNAARVPDVFAGAGCPCANSPATQPYTFGWQLDSVREGKILGAYIARRFSGEKVGVLFQDDKYGQGGVAGLDAEVPRSAIVATRSAEADAGSLSAQLASLKARGARVVVAFVGPALAARLPRALKDLASHPELVVSDAGETLPGGAITDSFLPAPGSAPKSPAGSWVALFRRIAQRYLPHAPLNASAIYGMAAAYTFAEAMIKAGPHVTRQGLVAAMTSGLPQGPAVAPLAWSDSDHTGATGAYVGVIRNGALVPLSGVMTTGNAPTSAVVPYSAAASSAPATGTPPG